MDLQIYEMIFNMIIYLFIFITGSCIGSFTNVMIHRIPRGEGIIFGRSRCPECDKKIKSFDLIPIISWIILLGKCRYCRNRISIHYPAIEFVTALFFLLMFITLGLGFKFFIGVFLFPVLVYLSVTDFIKTEIPYWCSGFIAILGIAAFIYSFFNHDRPIWHEHIVGLFIISIPFAVFAYLGAMGGGDVQLVAAAGLLLGLGIIPAVLIAFIIGSIFGIIIKVTKKRNRICFAPFLSTGIALAYLYGYDIIEFYLQTLK